MSKEVIIIGAGGYAKVIADIVSLCGDKVHGFLDDKDPDEMPSFHVIGKIKDIEKYAKEGLYRFIIAIGDNKSRKMITEKLEGMGGLKWYTAIHPSSVVAEGTEIGEGTAIMANAVINSGSRIGKGAIINTAATIDHDNVIDDFAHISPGAHLSGAVHIGESTWICVGGIVSNNINICNNCIIGAGAVVIRDIENSGTYIGIPAKQKVLR